MKHRHRGKRIGRDLHEVSDPNQQRRLYHRKLGEWAQKDAATVKQWVTANNVPADVVTRFSR